MKNKIVDLNQGTDMKLRFHVRKTANQYTVEGHTYVLETIPKVKSVEDVVVETSREDGEFNPYFDT